MRWLGNVARMVERRDAYSSLVGRPDGKRLLGRPRHKWANFEVRHPRFVRSITKNFVYYTIQSNTTIFHLVVQ